MMKVLNTLLLSLLFITLSGCGHYVWRFYFPPGVTESDFHRDIAYCNDYARTWCAIHGTIVVSGFGARDYYSGLGVANIYGNRECSKEQWENVRNDCMGMKGYKYERMKASSVQTTQPTVQSHFRREKKPSDEQDLKYIKSNLERDKLWEEYMKLKKLGATASWCQFLEYKGYRCN